MTIFTVAAEDILGENYELTKIECSDYNPNIDDSITLTITVTDVYDDPIDGENVTVTASEGTFTQLNGSDITSDSSVTGTTNSSGQFTLTYNCSEWGLITFSANNINTQIRVTGYIQTSLNNGMYTLYEYEYRVGLRIHISTAISFTNAIKVINDQHIPHRLAPRYPVMIVCANGNTATANTAIGVRESVNLEKTEIIVKSLSGSDVSREAYCYLEWDKKY